MYYLIALFPPGNIEREIIRIHTYFFSSYGFLSGQALPPHIPILFCSSVPEEKSLSQEARLEDRAVETGALVYYRGCLYLEANLEQTCRRIANRFKHRTGDRLFATFPGVFIAHQEGREPSLGDSTLWPSSIEPLHWRTTSLGCLTIDPAEPDTWWEHLYWEQLFMQKCR
jgi:hypothetical protein